MNDFELTVPDLYDKILIFPPPALWKNLLAARIDQLADSSEPAIR